MKTIILILVIGFIISLLYFYKLYEEVDNLGMDIEIGNIDFSNFNISDLFSNGSVIKTNITVYANNTGNVDLKYNSLIFALYYGGTLIAKTSDNKSNYETMVVSANSVTPITQEFNLYVNGNLINLISCAKSGSECQINYKLSLKWYIVPIPTISGTFGTK